MARIDITDFAAALDAGNAINGAAFIDGDLLFDLGMDAALGRGGAVDPGAAHMYFNLADAKGHEDAAYHRQDMAAQMSKAEVAMALRAARHWLTRH